MNLIGELHARGRGTDDEYTAGWQLVGIAVTERR
jgi:hypothetical protein